MLLAEGLGMLGLEQNFWIRILDRVRLDLGFGEWGLDDEHVGFRLYAPSILFLY